MMEWVSVSSGRFSGTDYETGKAASFRAGAGDIVINAKQPKSNLLRVLFERQSRISDSITYDITAWSVPFVYGVQAYGLNAYVPGASGNRAEGVTAGRVAAGAGNAGAAAEGRATPYGYAIRWTGMRSVRFLTEMLQKRVKGRYSERAFQSRGGTFWRRNPFVTGTGNGQFTNV